MHALVLLTATLLAGAPEARILAVEPARSTLGYNVVHKLREVRGESKAVEAKAALLAGGAFQVMVRVPVASFKSGDGNRDAHVQEVLEVGSFPYVVFKGTGRLVLPERYPATVELAVDGVLDFHGQKRRLKVPLKLELVSAEEARVRGEFAVSLEEHKVARPSLFFVKVEDACRIDLDLALKAEAR